jgi:hypothetical protein
MPARRLEDRIRALCARALYEKEPEWSATLHKLQSAIDEQLARIAKTNPETAKPAILERRQA